MSDPFLQTERPKPAVKAASSSSHHHISDPAPIHLPVHKTSNFSWGLLALILTILPIWFSRLHYALPKPQPPYDEKGRPQPSEEIVLKHIAALEKIGCRTVGTPQALAGEEYVLEQVLSLVEKCEQGGVLNCEWWHQKGSGFHAFEILDHEVLKGYVGISNIILKISAFHPPSLNTSAPRLEKDAVLLGSHIDSTLSSPGASDDGIGVGVMLDVARVLIETNSPFDASVIFMWNGGEETLQDGSHLYSTQHVTAPTVRAVINLEAAGSTGGALLFQATSKEMIEAFKHAPFPKGTVIAADVFSSGIIMSDTDFGQFEKYLGTSGLDMAVVGHSYFYHTHRDTIDNLERGTSQHFTSNIHAIILHLLSPSSPLLSSASFSSPDMVYLSFFDKWFVHWSMKKADTVYAVLGAVAAALGIRNLKRKGWKVLTIVGLGTPLAFLVGLTGANALAYAISSTGNSQLWFRHEHLPLLLYTPPVLFCLLLTHYLLSSTLSPVERTRLETTHYYGQLLYNSWVMLALQAGKIRSAYIYAFMTGLMTLGAIGNELGKFGRRGETEMMSFKMSYLVPSAGLSYVGVEAVTSILDIFTPLTGRMGKSAPSEHIIATLSSSFVIVFFPILLPLFNRVSRSSQRKLLGSLIVLGMSVGLALGKWGGYDKMHPKRAGVMYVYNHTDNTHTAHLAVMDRGPTLSFPEKLHSHFVASSRHSDISQNPLKHTVLTDYDSDWDVVYPVSTFLDTWKFSVPLEWHASRSVRQQDSGQSIWPEMGYDISDVKREVGIRQMHLTLNFTQLVWPTLAFDASVLEWSFPFSPPPEKMRHHIKIATSVDTPIAELQLTVKAEKWEKIKIHWSAFDLNQMVPSTLPIYDPDLPASKFLTAAHELIEDTWGKTLDVVSGGAVCGVVEV
ncbi:hypothetical protein L204_102917 [Cryptococcus depauperatus]|nr:hypothetical protein L204_00334 [Cryptococcus depauperatus CBS 7855]